MFANPRSPNLPDYTIFVQRVMGIPEAVLPYNSPFIGYALNRALNLVLMVPTVPGDDYTLAVYNCAGHIQLTITPDIVVDGVSYGYFEKLRQQFDLLKTVNGTVNASSDQGSSTSNTVSEALAELTIEDMGFMRTLWGRNYLGFNQDYGPTVWGLS